MMGSLVWLDREVLMLIEKHFMAASSVTTVSTALRVEHFMSGLEKTSFSPHILKPTVDKGA